MKRVNTCILSIFLVYATCLSMIDISQINLENPIPENLIHLKNISKNELEDWYEKLYQQHHQTLDEFFPNKALRDINNNLVALTYNPNLLIGMQKYIIAAHFSQNIDSYSNNTIGNLFLTLYDLNMYPINHIPIEEDEDLIYVTALTSNNQGDIAIAVIYRINGYQIPLVYRYEAKTNKLLKPIEIPYSTSIITAMHYVNDSDLLLSIQPIRSSFNYGYHNSLGLNNEQSKNFFLRICIVNESGKIIQKTKNTFCFENNDDNSNDPIYSIKYNSNYHEYYLFTLQGKMLLFNLKENSLSLLNSGQNSFSLKKLPLPRNKELILIPVYTPPTHPFYIPILDIVHSVITIKNFKKYRPLALICALKLSQLFDEYENEIQTHTWQPTLTIKKPIEKIHEDWISYFNELPENLSEKFILLIHKY